MGSPSALIHHGKIGGLGPVCRLSTVGQVLHGGIGPSDDERQVWSNAWLVFKTVIAPPWTLQQLGRVLPRKSLLLNNKCPKLHESTS
jgi:hypothetical protein